jgi:hypothetical protein
MRFWVRLIAIALSAAVAAGCATPGTSNIGYLPPENPTKMSNEVVVDKPFESVWDALVRDLAKSFYVINNIEKQSRLINVSFSTDAPETYVDCGTTTRTYARGDENQTYKYNVASSFTYKVAARTGNLNQFPVTRNISRRTVLEGRANIYVAPEGQGTRVSVNARYILSVNTQGVYTVENVYGTPIERGALPQRTFTATFNTNQPTTVDWGTPGQPMQVTCHSRGRLEHDILQLVQ